MKRFKELLWFVGSLVGLSIVAVLLWLFPIGDVTSFPPAFVGREEYMRLFLHDPTFLKSVFFTYVSTALYGLVGIALFTAVACAVKRKVRISRPVYYAISGGVGSITVFAVNMGTVIVVSRALGGVSVLLNNILTALQCGVLAVFVVWIGEMVFRLIRRAKAKGDHIP